MNIAQIENNIQEIIKSFNKDTFIYDLLLSYGFAKASMIRLKGNLNLSKIQGEIAWKKKLLFKEIYIDDLHETIDSLRNDSKSLSHNPRFIIVTDYKTLLAVDTKTNETLDIPIENITKHYDFFFCLGQEWRRLNFKMKIWRMSRQQNVWPSCMMRLKKKIQL